MTDSGKTDIASLGNPPERVAGVAPRTGAQGLQEAIEYLRALKNSGMPMPKAAILEMLYVDCIKAVESRLTSISEMPLPLPGRPRKIIRDIQDALETLAGLLMTPREAESEQNEAAPPGGLSARSIWRAIHLLSRHLLISSLTAAPPGTGIWKQLHRTYALACLLGVAQSIPAGVTRTPRDKYFSAVLLGCAQPTSFTGREILFLDTYLECFSDYVDTNRAQAKSSLDFWIDPESDTSATAYSRRPPTPGTLVSEFSCGPLASLLESQLAALENGTPPGRLDLSAYAATQAGFSVLTRLVHLWGNPGKRRFPRRRQNYRGRLCLGFNNIHRLYAAIPQTAETSEASETSEWMITNESPDGYAVMHLSGKIRTITVGCIAALRTESGEDWQLCIIRWVLSENQEHIELGLQILSPRAYAANIALPAKTGVTPSRYPALVLPSTAIRPNESLLVRSGALAGHPAHFVLVIERDNVEVREIDDIECDERNSVIELYGIKSK